MKTDLRERVAQPEPELAAEETNTAQTVECPSCQAKVLLFSRTIQTYCYQCGLAVTQLDVAGLYYELAGSAKA